MRVYGCPTGRNEMFSQITVRVKDTNRRYGAIRNRFLAMSLPQHIFDCENGLRLKVFVAK